MAQVSSPDFRRRHAADLHDSAQPYLCFSEMRHQRKKRSDEVRRQETIFCNHGFEFFPEEIPICLSHVRSGFGHWVSGPFAML